MMKKKLSTLAVLGALVTALPAIAQQQPQQRPAAPVKSSHGDWEVRCVAANDCFMTQITQAAENRPPVVFTVFTPPGLTDENGQPIQALAEIVVPLGIFLPPGLALQVDNGQPSRAPFERCIPEGCVVRAPISDPMLDRLKRGGTATLLMFASPDQQVNVPVSLRGFTAAFGDL